MESLRWRGQEREAKWLEAGRLEEEAWEAVQLELAYVCTAAGWPEPTSPSPPDPNAASGAGPRDRRAAVLTLLDQVCPLTTAGSKQRLALPRQGLRVRFPP